MNGEGVRISKAGGKSFEILVFFFFGLQVCFFCKASIELVFLFCLFFEYSLLFNFVVPCFAIETNKESLGFAQKNKTKGPSPKKPPTAAARSRAVRCRKRCPCVPTSGNSFGRNTR